MAKTRKERGEEQRQLAGFFEDLNRALFSYDFELGGDGAVPKFVKNDGYTYTLLFPNRKKFVIRVEPSEDPPVTSVPTSGGDVK